MEVPSANHGMRHREMSLLRVFRGLICLLVLLSTAFMMIVYCGFLTTVILRLFSIHYSRKVTSFFFGAWLALWPFLLEKINKTKVIFSGDDVPARERVLLICNHRTEVDWMYLWNLALRKDCLGYINEQKCLRSKKYAAENGLPILKNLLLPKSKGFYACLEDLRSSLDAVYDVTINYKHLCPSFLDNVFGVDPSEVHIHVRRITLDDVPISEREVTAWLMDTFQRKDQLLFNFKKEGYFPQQGTEVNLSAVKCLVNVMLVLVLTSACTFFTFFSSIWFKVFLSLSCAYMASATYFNTRPVPIFSFVKT
ncbi:hypothetical protein CRYUN_Cryun04dG0068000 [Craigia yunnanensis]